jgi:hypothetical protein
MTLSPAAAGQYQHDRSSQAVDMTELVEVIMGAVRPSYPLPASTA